MPEQELDSLRLPVRREIRVVGPSVSPNQTESAYYDSEVADGFVVRPEQRRRCLLEYQAIRRELDCFPAHHEVGKVMWNRRVHAVRQEISEFEADVGPSTGSGRQKCLEGLTRYLRLLACRPTGIPSI